MIKSTTVITLLLALLPAALWAGDPDIAIVVNKANPADSVSKVQLRKMLLGEQGQWGHGAKVSVILRSSGPERDTVLRALCGMNATEFAQYFVHANFNGETGAMPKSMASATALRQLVVSIPGAIGFLLVSDVNDSVKVLKLDGAAPGDAGYKLKGN